MIVVCLFFAYSKELAGCGRREFDIPEGTNTKQFIDEYLLIEFPKLKESIDSFLIALNQEYVDPTSPKELSSNSEIAVIPPVSGG